MKFMELKLGVFKDKSKLEAQIEEASQQIYLAKNVGEHERSTATLSSLQEQYRKEYGRAYIPLSLYAPPETVELPRSSSQRFASWLEYVFVKKPKTRHTITFY